MKLRAIFKKFMLLMQLAAIMVLFVSAGIATASDAITLQASQPYTMYYTTNGIEVSVPLAVENEKKNKELKKKLLKKYDLDIDTLTIRLEHTQHGPKGHINLMRKRSHDQTNSTKASIISKEDNHPQINTIVREFLTEEEELFGINNLDELCETRFKTDELGFTVIEFQRYIDQLPLENSYIQFFFRSTDEISSVAAELISAPPELYEAAKKETLSEAQAREIAEEALRGLGFDANIDLSIRKYLKAEKVAIPTPPYILWKVRSNWTILIDAFTGEVLEKHNNIRR